MSSACNTRVIRQPPSRRSCGHGRGQRRGRAPGGAAERVSGVRPLLGFHHVFVRVSVLSLAVSFSTFGCVAIFRHETLPARITIAERDTGRVLPAVKVTVGYLVDAYHYLYIHNRPEAAKGETNADGWVVLPVADFEYGTVFGAAAYAQVELTPAQVRSGGRFPMRNRGSSNEGKPVLVLELERPAE